MLIPPSYSFNDHLFPTVSTTSGSVAPSVTRGTELFLATADAGGGRPVVVKSRRTSRNATGRHRAEIYVLQMLRSSAHVVHLIDVIELAERNFCVLVLQQAEPSRRCSSARRAPGSDRARTRAISSRPSQSATGTEFTTRTSALKMCFCEQIFRRPFQGLGIPSATAPL